LFLFQVGDMISVIDMPPPEESLWWRGKRGFEVGFFPCECVEVITTGHTRVNKGGKCIKGHHICQAQVPPGGGGRPGGGGGPSTGGGSSGNSSLREDGSGGEATTTDEDEDDGDSDGSSPDGGQRPTKPVLRKHGKLISFFRSFILSRPTRGKLKKSGILKERVFGCDLSEHLMNIGEEGKNKSIFVIAIHL
jgi:hypothetical protein